jgi:hypothetical protein
MLPIDTDFEPGATQRQHARLRGSVYVLLSVLAHADNETVAAMQYPQNRQQQPHQQQQHACHWSLNDQSEDMQIC